MKYIKKFIVIALCLSLFTFTGCSTKGAEENVYFGKLFPVYIDMILIHIDNNTEKGDFSRFSQT